MSNGPLDVDHSQQTHRGIIPKVCVCPHCHYPPFLSTPAAAARPCNTPLLDTWPLPCTSAGGVKYQRGFLTADSATDRRASVSGVPATPCQGLERFVDGPLLPQPDWERVSDTVLTVLAPCKHS